MQRKEYEGISVNYYDADEPVGELRGKGYRLVKTAASDAGRVSALLERGFCFHERYLDYVIIPGRLEQRLVKMVRADVREGHAMDGDMTALACRAFDRDRRFHLDPAYSQETAGKIIRGFLKELSRETLLTYKCYHGEKPVGFTIVRPDNAGGCENLLGAVEPDYRKKGAAFNLYIFMTDSLRKKGFETLTGSISSGNIASLNLHLMLGAAFTDAWDHYIKRDV